MIHFVQMLDVDFHVQIGFGVCLSIFRIFCFCYNFALNSLIAIGHLISFSISRKSVKKNHKRKSKKIKIEKKINIFISNFHVKSTLVYVLFLSFRFLWILFSRLSWRFGKRKKKTGCWEFKVIGLRFNPGNFGMIYLC